MKKIIFFDIDGTIITEDKNSIVPESTLEAISLAKKNGCYIFINTGRTICNIEKRLRDIGFDGYICGCGTYIEYGGENIFYHRTPSNIQKLIVETIAECNAIPVYEGSKALYYDMSHENTDRIDWFKKEFLKDEFPFFTTECDDMDFDKFIFWENEKTNKEKLYSVVSQYYSMINRGGGLYENVPLGHSKATGIYKILDILEIDIENAYAIGDSMNDLPMLKAVPNSIAMGQGKSVHEYVSYVTTDIYNDGIWNALKHYELI